MISLKSDFHSTYCHFRVIFTLYRVRIHAPPPLRCHRPSARAPTLTRGRSRTWRRPACAPAPAAAAPCCACLRGRDSQSLDTARSNSACRGISLAAIDDHLRVIFSIYYAILSLCSELSNRRSPRPRAEVRGAQMLRASAPTVGSPNPRSSVPTSLTAPAGARCI